MLPTSDSELLAKWQGPSEVQEQLRAHHIADPKPREALLQPGAVCEPPQRVNSNGLIIFRFCGLVVKDVCINLTLT